MDGDGGWGVFNSLVGRVSGLFLACLHACLYAAVCRKFAPRCCVCQLPIMPKQGEDETIRIVAMDKSFHIECYRCEVSTSTTGLIGSPESGLPGFGMGFAHLWKYCMSVRVCVCVCVCVSWRVYV